MKKVLVTGADGFIGSHLVEQLWLAGYSVRAFCYYNSFNSWGWLDTLDKQILDNIEVVSGDIRDYKSINIACKDIQDLYHLAALIAIPYSYSAPDSYIETNVKGTLHILESSLSNKVERVMITSTSEVYGTATYVPIDEKHPKQPQSPYSASKISADALALSYYYSFGLPVTIVRPFNTFGPRQSARAVIPTIISQLINGFIEVELGDLIPTRDLVYVKDTAKGFIEIGKSTKLIGEEINIASNSEISIGQLAEKIIQKINPSAKIKNSEIRKRPANSEVFRLLGSNKKLLENTTWKMNYTLDEALDETIHWFSKAENIRKYKANIYNV